MRDVYFPKRAERDHGMEQKGSKAGQILTSYVLGQLLRMLARTPHRCNESRHVNEDPQLQAGTNKR